MRTSWRKEMEAHTTRSFVCRPEAIEFWQFIDHEGLITRGNEGTYTRSLECKLEAIDFWQIRDKILIGAHVKMNNWHFMILSSAQASGYKLGNWKTWSDQRGCLNSPQLSVPFIRLLQAWGLEILDIVHDKF